MAITVEELQIKLSVEADSVKRQLDNAMDAIKSSVSSAMQTINSKTQHSLDPLKEQTDKASKAMDQLKKSTTQTTTDIKHKIEDLGLSLERSSDRIDNQKRLVEDLFKQYQQLADARGVDDSKVIRLEKAWLGAEQQLDNYLKKDRQLALEYEKYQQIAEANGRIEMSHERTASVIERVGDRVAEAGEQFRSATASAKLFIASLTKTAGLKTLGVFNKLGTSLGKIGINAYAAKGAFNALSTVSEKLSSGFQRVTRVISLMLLRMSVRAVIKNFGKELQNLAVYSSEFNAAMSEMKASVEYAGRSLVTALAPAIQAVAPLITWLANIVAQAASAISQFFAAITGKNTYVAAKKGTADYAAGVEDVTGATKDANKQLDRFLHKFDELNVQNTQSNLLGGLGAGGAGGGVGDLFETKEIEGKFKELAKKMKKIAKQIFKPIQDAWNTYGKQVMDAWSYAVHNVWEAIKEMGRDWLTVWTNGTGEKVVGNILKLVISLGNWIGDIAVAWRAAWSTYGLEVIQSFFDKINAILELIHSVSEAFRNAWNDNGTGQAILEKIMQIWIGINRTVEALAINLRLAWDENGRGQSIASAIFQIIDNILGTVLKLVESTRDWVRNLDFRPLLDSVDFLLKQLDPFTQKVGEGLHWFYENVLLPLGKWTLERAVPTFLDLVGKAVGFVNTAIDAAKPMLLFLWDYILKPAAKFVGDAIVWTLEKIGDALEWISKHQLAVDIITAFGIALGIVIAAVKVWNVIGVIAATVTYGLGAAVNFLMSPMTLVVIAIAAIIAVVLLLIKYWDEIKETFQRVWDWIVEKFNAIVEWFGEKIQNIKDWFSGLWDGIKEKAGAVVDWITEKWEGFKEFIWGIVESIIGFFVGLKDDIVAAFKFVVDWIYDKWDGVTSWFGDRIADIGNFFSGLWDKITGIFGKVKEWFTDKFEAAVTGIKNAFSSVGEFFSGVWDGIKDTFKNVTEWFRNTFSNAWAAVKNAFTKGGEIFAGIKDAIGESLKGMINYIIRGINVVVGTPFNWINSIFRSMRTWSVFGYTIFSWLPEIPVPKIPELAQGGVLTEETVVKMGEYAGAKNDPEIAAPQHILMETFLKAQSPLTSMLAMYLPQIIELMAEMDMTVELDGKKVSRAISGSLAGEFHRSGNPAF